MFVGGVASVPAQSQITVGACVHVLGFELESFSLFVVGIICEEGIPETQCWKVMRVFWTTERCVSLNNANVSFTMMLP